MTISNQNAVVTIEGNDSQTSFSYTFEIPYQSDGVTPAIKVYLVVDDVETLLTITTDYTVTGIGESSGGAVSYPVSGDPLATGDFIRIQRDLDYTQPYEFLNQAFLPSQIETALDAMEMQVQQLNALVTDAAAPEIVTSFNGDSGAIVEDLTRHEQVTVFGGNTTVITGDGIAYWMVPTEYTSILITSVAAAVATVSSSGTPTVQLHKVTGNIDILTTPITIDINEPSSFTAAVPPVVDTANSDLGGGRLLRIDCDVAGTGTKGLFVSIAYTVFV